MRYVIAVFLVATFPPAILWWYVVHPFAGFWRRLGARTTIWIMGVGSVVMIAILVYHRRRLVFGDLGFSVPLLVGGLALWGMSIVLDQASRRHLTRRILAGVPELSEGEEGVLLQEGVYSRIRHPRYVAVAIGLVGLALVANYRSLYWITGVMLVALAGITVVEERELRERFGQAYVDYARHVPRFIPRLRR